MPRRQEPVRPEPRGPDVDAARNRKQVHAALMDCLELLRYQRDRWSLGPWTRGVPRVNAAPDHSAAWRALADDLDVVIGWAAQLRDTARDEQHRLAELNGDSRDG